MSSSRSIYNPYQKDTVLFLETFNETGGRYTLVEVEMAAGGGNGLHYHNTYAETFECFSGELKIQVGKNIHTLQPGESATAHPHQLHRFFNDSDKACKFKVTITPGCKGFEETLQIAYGLARDGRVNSKGMPTKLSHLGLLLVLSESKLPGWQGVIEKVFRLVGKRALKNGIADELRKQYVTIQ
jgi:quercetin dioxygenase-like cupin family protein